MDARKYRVVHNGVSTIMKLTEKEQQALYPGAEPYEKEQAEGDPDERAAERKAGTRTKARTPQNKGS